MKSGPFNNCDLHLVAIDVKDFHAGMGKHEIPALRPKQALIAPHLDNDAISTTRDRRRQVLATNIKAESNTLDVRSQVFVRNFQQRHDGYTPTS